MGREQGKEGDTMGVSPWDRRGEGEGPRLPGEAPRKPGPRTSSKPSLLPEECGVPRNGPVLVSPRPLAPGWKQPTGSTASSQSQ